MTYLLLIAIFGAASLVLLLVARRRLAPRALQAMLLAFVALAVLTIVFDSLMIAADLFSYGPGTTGIRLWLAPIEDLAYPAVALLVGVAVWSLVPARPRADADRTREGRA
ncbi:lycopene cyclase domain-containing protein [Agrococcus jejuensis]|uniref:lycopene cyclase domain-containing protein n=1 Tax=Agrococcus jejuensis TaxID=399736 RepID=UPI00119DDA2F|nr:lycopene cyclase domain-containing protein [Agrococcus jejuensis]